MILKIKSRIRRPKFIPLTLIDVVFESDEPIFYIKDSLHVSVSKFNIKHIEKDNVIQNLDPKSSFIVGRVINDFYNKNLKFDKVSINDSGAIHLYSSFDREYRYSSHLDKVFLNDEIVSNCTPNVIRAIASQKSQFEIKKILYNISNHKSTQKENKNNIINFT